VEECEKLIKRVLIVDDEPGVRESLRMLLKDAAEPVVVSSAAEALAQLAAAPFDVVLLDIVMPGIDGLELLAEIRGRHPTLPVVMLTATRTVKTAVGAMKLGAFDYLTKPFDVDELRLVLDKATENAALVREVEALRTEVGRRYHIDNVVGRSPGMQEAFKTVLTVAPRKTTVLITGDSGTGKELIAKAIHYGSPRARKPLVTLNCAAIPETLLESELFGHERGSFTDAHAKKLGQFELAHESTLFLDEIAEMGSATQAKLLRVLESGEFLRVGGQRPVRVDVRIVAATNRDLSAAIRDGSFRSDLYYRLNVVAVHLPPLRERQDDLVPLIRHFVQTKSRAMGMPEKPIRSEAVDALLRYGWPGNVRELENLIENRCGATTAGRRDRCARRCWADRSHSGSRSTSSSVTSSWKRSSRPTSTRPVPPSAWAPPVASSSIAWTSSVSTPRSAMAAPATEAPSPTAAPRLHLDR
jgi:DNA-binding NtrC family response regulator